jgi:hypothetical protein
MMGFKGRISFLQYMPAKRTRFGIKNWALNESKSGFALKLTPYTGKSNDVQEAGGDGLSARVVKKLLVGYQNKGHHVYMDNFYSSPDLFDTLQSEGIGACGTVRANRKGLPVEFKAKMKKGDPIRYQRRDALLACQFFDKKCVQGLSTIHTADNMNKRVRCKGGAREVIKPKLIDDYNSYMGGTDKMDQLSSYYDFPHRATKWYMMVYHYLREVCLVNAYILYTQYMNTTHVKPLSTIEFRCKVVEGLVAGYERHPAADEDQDPDNEEGGVLRRDHTAGLTDNFRLTGRHFLEIVPGGSKPDCVVCSDRKAKQRHQTCLRCKQCQKPLCPASCFERFHTVKNYKVAY